MRKFQKRRKPAVLAILPAATTEGDRSSLRVLLRLHYSINGASINAEYTLPDAVSVD